MKIPYVNLSYQNSKYKKTLTSIFKKILDSGEYVGGKEVIALKKEIPFQIQKMTEGLQEMIEDLVKIKNHDLIKVDLENIDIIEVEKDQVYLIM